MAVIWGTASDSFEASFRRIRCCCCTSTPVTVFRASSRAELDKSAEKLHIAKNKNIFLQEPPPRRRPLQHVIAASIADARRQRCIKMFDKSDYVLQLQEKRILLINYMEESIGSSLTWISLNVFSLSSFPLLQWCV